MIVLKPGYPGYSDTLDKAAEEAGKVRTTCIDPFLIWMSYMVYTAEGGIFLIKDRGHMNSMDRIGPWELISILINSSNKRILSRR